jgi:cellulose synthase/poly-beta-1,6-N-acetylglucosamine synthase-like glycosyltransferase
MLSSEEAAAAYGWPIPRRAGRGLQSVLVEFTKHVAYRIHTFFFKFSQSRMGFVYNLMGCAVMYRLDAYRRVPRPDDSYAGDTAHAWELQALGYRVNVVLDAFVYTTEPPTLRAFLRQRLRWGSGPFQNLYLRGRRLLRSLRGRRRLAALYSILYYTVISLKYSITMLVLPLLHIAGLLDWATLAKVYTVDFTVYAAAYAIATAYLHRVRSNPLTSIEGFKEAVRFLAFYLITRPLWLASYVASAIITLRDILAGRSWRGLH